MSAFFSLDGVTIKNPSTFKIERYNITSSSRVASGLMMMDLIAQKKKFYFTYEKLEMKDYDTIVDLLWDRGNVFFNFEYFDNNRTKRATVYAGSMPAELKKVWENGVCVWQNVTFDLVEQ